MLKKKWTQFIEKLKSLTGDPHHIAFGMAIGVFIAMTPTMPFHTIFAIALALLLRASKPAAIIGVWVSNPFTMVFLYFTCFKVGHFFFENSSQAWLSIEVLIDHLESDIEFSYKIIYFIEFIKTEIHAFMIMIAGGVILGLPSALLAYGVTRFFLIKLRKN